MVFVSLVSLFVLDIELIEIEEVGRKCACLRTKTFVPVVARDVVSELLFGL